MPVEIAGSTVYSELKNHIVSSKESPRNAVEAFEKKHSHAALLRMRSMENSHDNLIKQEYSKATSLSGMSSLKLTMKKIFGGYHNTYRQNLAIVRKELLVQSLAEKQLAAINSLGGNYEGSDTLAPDHDTEQLFDTSSGNIDDLVQNLPGIRDNQKQQNILKQGYQNNVQLLNNSNKKLLQALKEIEHLDKLALKNPKYNKARKKALGTMHKNLSNTKAAAAIDKIAQETPLGAAIESLTRGKNKNDAFRNMLQNQKQWSQIAKSQIDKNQPDNFYQVFNNQVRTQLSSINDTIKSNQHFKNSEDLVKYFGLMKLGNSVGFEAIHAMEQNPTEQAEGELFWNNITLEDSIKTSGLGTLSKNLESVGTNAKTNDQDIDYQFAVDALRGRVVLHDTNKTKSIVVNEAASQQVQDAGPEKNKAAVKVFDNWVAENISNFKDSEKHNIAASLKSILQQGFASELLNMTMHGLDMAGHMHSIFTQNADTDSGPTNLVFNVNFDDTYAYVDFRHNSRLGFVGISDHADYLKNNLQPLIDANNKANDQSPMDIKAHIDIKMKVKLSDLANLHYDSLQVTNLPTQKLFNG